MKARHAVKATWLALEDAEAHAHVRGAKRTACGRPAIDPRFAWPARGRCPACVAAIERLEEEVSHG